MKRGLKAIKEAWLLDAICTDGYDVVAETDKEKLEFIANNIRGEAIYPHNVARFKGNMTNLIADHLRGLPSWICIPYYNYDIESLLISWGYKIRDDNHRIALVDNYWNATANIIMQLFKKHDIKL